MELMKEKPSVTQLEIAKYLELSITKIQSVIKERLKSVSKKETINKHKCNWARALILALTLFKRKNKLSANPLRTDNINVFIM